MRPARSTIALTFMVVWFVLALGYSAARDISITADPVIGRWDFFWQLLPVSALADNPLGELWQLHSQPPLYNALLAALLKLFPPLHPLAGGERALHALHLLHLLLAGGIVGMVFLLSDLLLPRRRWAMLSALLFALNPALLLFAAYPLYDLLCAFLLTAAVTAATLYMSDPRLRWPGTAVGLLTILALTRSFFHLLVPAAAALAALAAIPAGQRRRAALVLLLLLAPAGAWYGKNLCQFGFFGGSSWLGLNLWHGAAARYSPQDLRDLAARGVIDPLPAEVRAFSPPSAYRPHGFTASSPQPALQRDDFNNSNIIAIARTYERNAWRLMAHDPAHYLRTALWSYKLFCLPSSSFRHLQVNAGRLGDHVRISEEYVHGAAVTRALQPVFGEDAGSLLVPLLPMLLLAAALPLLRQLRRSGFASVAANAGRWSLLALCAYTLAAGTLLECNDNTRFKFMIEPLLWVLLWDTVASWFTPARRATASAPGTPAVTGK